VWVYRVSAANTEKSAYLD
jgi:hypothetical protein